VVSTEKVVFYRENSAGMYSSLAYAVGQVSGSLAMEVLVHLGLINLIH
jgi:hypothetical protein